MVPAVRGSASGAACGCCSGQRIRGARARGGGGSRSVASRGIRRGAVRTKRSANAFAFGARTGVLMIRMPSLAKTASKSRANLLSRSRMRKRNGVRRSWIPPGELAGLLTDPGAGRVCRAAGQVDTSAAEIDEEQHVQPLQRDRLDREQVDREHARGLCSQKGTPGQLRRLPTGPSPVWRRILATVVAETAMPSPFSSPAIRC